MPVNLQHLVDFVRLTRERALALSYAIKGSNVAVLVTTKDPVNFALIETAFLMASPFPATIHSNGDDCVVPLRASASLLLIRVAGVIHTRGYTSAGMITFTDFADDKTFEAADRTLHSVTHFFGGHTSSYKLHLESLVL